MKNWILAALAAIALSTAPAWAQFKGPDQRSYPAIVPPNKGGTGSPYGPGVYQFPNNTSTGTTLYGLVTKDSSGNVESISAGASGGALGVCVAGCGKSGTAWIYLATGDVTMACDGAVTQNDYVNISASNNGQCHDTGQMLGTGTPPAGIETLGFVDQASTSGAGNAKVFFYGPDFPQPSAGGSGVNSGTVGNPGVYNTATTISPAPGIFHVTASGTDQIFKILTTQGKCLDGSNNPKACDIIVDPGVSDTETGPDLLGYMNCGGSCNVNQTLIIDNAKVTFNDTTTWPQDDGLVLGPNSTLKCIGYGGTNVGIFSSSGAQLNSLVTTLGGVVLNKWQANHAMVRGQFIFDSGSDSGSGAVWRILSCTGNCTTSGSNPLPASANTATRWGTQTDNNITWQNIQVGSRFSLSAAGINVDGCYMGTLQSAQVNNTFRIAGATGLMGVVSNIQPQGIGTGLGSDDQTGGDAFLIDPGQNNGFCTGSAAPLACCTGPAAGNCQNGGNGTALISIQGIEPGPTGAVGPNTGYIMRITGVGCGSAGCVGHISIDGGEMGDIGATSGSLLKALLSIDNTASYINFNNFYWENSTGQPTTPTDIITVDNGREIMFTGAQLSGTTTATNQLHIKTTGTTDVFYKGNLGSSTTGTNAIKNDIDGYTLAATSGQQVVYDYGPSSSTYGYLFDGRPVKFYSNVTPNGATSDFHTALSIDMVAMP